MDVARMKSIQQALQTILGLTLTRSLKVGLPASSGLKFFFLVRLVHRRAEIRVMIIPQRPRQSILEFPVPRGVNTLHGGARKPYHQRLRRSDRLGSGNFSVLKAQVVSGRPRTLPPADTVPSYVSFL